MAKTYRQEREEELWLKRERAIKRLRTGEGGIVYYHMTDDEAMDPVQLRIDVSWEGVYAGEEFQNWSIDQTERERKASERELLREIGKMKKIPVKLTYEQYKNLPDFPGPRPQHRDRWEGETPWLARRPDVPVRQYTRRRKR